MKNKKLLYIITFISIFILLITFLSINNNGFIIPKNDINAVKGVPEEEKNLGFGYINADTNYKIGINSILNLINKNEVFVNFTSDENNTMLLKLRIFDSNDFILGESGIIHPGEYIKTVKLKKILTKDTNVKLKVMGYEKGTYYSAGAFILNAEIKVKP